MTTKTTAPSIGIGVHHVGMTVADLEDALRFWHRFLGLEPRWRTVLDRPYLGRQVGYPGVRIKAAIIDLPGAHVLELLEYQVEDKARNPEATANPGNVHLCLSVDDADAVWERAVAAGARPVAQDGPGDVDGGPNRGARTAYLRVHDGITVELFQSPGDLPA
jgi:catechol 2,3-dioxygenase-like lactoylglutathione lyase family enzyme